MHLKICYYDFATDISKQNILRIIILGYFKVAKNASNDTCSFLCKLYHLKTALFAFARFDNIMFTNNAKPFTYYFLHKLYNILW